MIRWPQEFHPSRVPVHVRNELDMRVSPEAVWAWLVRAVIWPTWYPNSKNVRILQGPGPELAPGTRFRWRTFGVNIESVVEEFVPYERIAWSARGLGVRAYHAWLIQKTADGCHVLTEETQYGWLARLGKVFVPNRMHHHHQIWLEQLHQKAASGPPPEKA
ncbi:MAG: SRPBCC domain-containing protein [Terriglobia bacterium]